MDPIRIERHGTVVELVLGDIVRETTDVIVNAASADFSTGGAVDAAICGAGGPEVTAERRALTPYGFPEGYTLPTSAGHLSAKRIYHSAGPVWKGGTKDEPYLLSSCYLTALVLAEKEGHDSIAFPSLSTGLHGYPVDLAAPIALAAIGAWLRKPHRMKRIRLVLHDESTFATYRDTLSLFVADDVAARTLNRCRAVFRGVVSPDTFGLAEEDIHPSTFSRDMVEALGCTCLEFHQATSNDLVMDTYRTYRQIGTREGFMPLLLRPEMSTEHVKASVEPEHVSALGKHAVDEATTMDIAAWMSEQMGRIYPGEIADLKRGDGPVSPIPARNEIGYRFLSPYEGELCDSWNILLACIPETEPWKLPAWITPQGGGDTPTAVEQMAFFRRWHEAYGAVPVMVESAAWSLSVERPPTTLAAAEELAWEHFAFCPDCIYELPLASNTIHALAAQLLNAKAWHFWWD